MKLRIVVLSLVVFSLCLTSVALVASSSAPEASLRVFPRGSSVLCLGSATGGTTPYSYFWSFDGGPFVEGGPFNELICHPSFNDSIAFKVIDDNGEESNIESYDCP